MKTVTRLCGKGITLICLVALAAAANGATVGTGPLVEFRPDQ